VSGRPGGEPTGGSGDGVDPVTLEVVRNACTALAEEMNATLVRTAYSPNITDRRDCSSALFDPAGELVSQAESIPVHLGAMPHSVAAALEAFPRETLEPGDAVLLNDPFHGGAHLPDLTLIAPLFEGDDLVAIAANRAHHADVGGATAGSVAADSTEIYAEGLRIPPVKLYEAGERNDAVHDLLFANVRTPDERAGDLRAQHAANGTARDRFGEIVDRYGRGTVAAALSAIKDYAEERTRAEIGELPAGRYAFEDTLDGDGQGPGAVTIAAEIEIGDDELRVDFTGTDEQVSGAVNAPIAVTASATYYAARCVIDPDIPPSAGAYRPIEIEAPAGTVVNAEPPAAVVGGNLEVSQRIVDVLFGAFAAAAPERVAAAGQGTMNNLTLGGTDPRDGSPFAFYETAGGGSGGRASGDGMDGVHVHMSNTRNTPVEVLETAYPLRVRRYALRPDSGGAGEFRGGLGLRRDIEARTDVTCSVLADRRRGAPYGIAGGAPGATGEDYLLSGGECERIDPKSTRELTAGGTVSLRTPGGGGYGEPASRDETLIARDLRLGKVSRERVRTVYGLDPDALGADGSDTQS